MLYMRTGRMHRGADVEQRAEPCAARSCACAQSSCKEVPTSSGGQSHAPLDAVHAHRAHTQRCRCRAAGRAAHRST
eukprot:3352532-Pleurochrysis_carterae.AAC.1